MYQHNLTCAQSPDHDFTVWEYLKQEKMDQSDDLDFFQKEISLSLFRWFGKTTGYTTQHNSREAFEKKEKKEKNQNTSHESHA